MSITLRINENKGIGFNVKFDKGADMFGLGLVLGKMDRGEYGAGFALGNRVLYFCIEIF